MTIRRLDPGHSSVGLSVRHMMSRIPGRRRRRQPTAVMAALVVSGLVASAVVIAGLGAWWLRRHDQAALARGQTLHDAAFDEAALDRAADEGMTAPSVPDPQETPAASNGAVREPVAIGGLARLV